MKLKISFTQLTTGRIQMVVHSGGHLFVNWKFDPSLEAKHLTFPDKAWTNKGYRALPSSRRRELADVFTLRVKLFRDAVSTIELDPIG